MLSTLCHATKLGRALSSRNVAAALGTKGWSHEASKAGLNSGHVRLYAARKGGVVDEAVPNGGLSEGADEITNNQFEGKETGEQIRKAFSSRAGDAIRYEYFAQRAELESETDAAPLFRSLSESARQQAMGYLELMEEYGDCNFGSTMENLDFAADSERTNAQDALTEAAKVAAGEGFDHVEEWFEDMTDASYRAASKVEQIQNLLEEEMMPDGLHEDAEEDHDFEQKRQH